MPQNALGQTVIKNEGNAQLDAAVKEVLANKQILARILKECVTEYKDCDLRDIEEKYIEGEPCIGSIPVHRTSDNPNIHGMNTEDKTTSEGTQFFDIRFAAVLPDSQDRIGLIINIEAQNDFHPGYPLVRRGIYYCCRLISMQYGETFTEPKYGDIKKVYSIWICTNATDQRADPITRYKIEEECVKGESRAETADFDLMNVVQINFNDKMSADGLNGLLKILLSNHLTGMQKEEILPHLTFVNRVHSVHDPIAGAAVEILDWDIADYEQWEKWKYRKLLNPYEETGLWQIDPRWIYNESKKLVVERAQKLFRQNPFSVCPIVCWYLIKENELDVIRTAAECIRMGENQEKAMSLAGVTEEING